MHEPWVKAWQPDPADGAVNVALPLLRWIKGETAVAHDVYFGTTPDLTAADLIAARTTVAASFPPGVLGPGTKYYWRIDEVELDGTIHTGDVWSFSTPSLLAFDPGRATAPSGSIRTPSRSCGSRVRMPSPTVFTSARTSRLSPTARAIPPKATRSHLPLTRARWRRT